MASKKPAGDKPATRKMRKKHKILLILFCLITMAVLRTGFVFILVAMLPSIVAYYFDQTQHRYTFKSIFYCNAAGVLPYFAQMVKLGPSSANLQSIMNHPLTWFIVFGAAGMGYILTTITPIIAQMLIGSLHNTQVRGLQRTQKKIEKEWGAEITKFGLDTK